MNRTGELSTAEIAFPCRSCDAFYELYNVESRVVTVISQGQFLHFCTQHQYQDQDMNFKLIHFFAMPPLIHILLLYPSAIGTNGL